MRWQVFQEQGMDYRESRIVVGPRAIQSLEVIRHLSKQAPKLEIVVFSITPEFLIKQNAEISILVCKRSLDVGLV
jgi:hypothetical protein